MRKPELVWVDTESGGLLDENPTIQIAAIATDYELTETGRFECKLLFDIGACQDEALSLNSYDPMAWAAEAVSPLEACNGFADFLRKHSTVEMISKKSGRPYYVAQGCGHNCLVFDGPRIQRLFKSLNLFLPMGFFMLDTCQRAAWHFHEHPEEKRPENMKLQTLAEHFRLSVDGAAHDAMGDVLMTIELYRKLRKWP